jgi:hypothetical protein
MKSANCFVIGVPTRPQFMPRLIFPLDVFWHSLGREVPDEETETSAGDYLALRRSLGSKLKQHGKFSAGVAFLS